MEATPGLASIQSMSRPDDYERIEHAIRFLREERKSRPSLEDVAAEAGLSPFHFQRLFQRWAGTTPKRFLSYLGAEAARAHLARARSVLDATYAAGLSSPGRLHDLMVTVQAVTPGEVRREGEGLAIEHGVAPSPLGPMFVARSPRGLVAVSFGEPEAARERLARDWPRAHLTQDHRAADEVSARIFGGGDETPLPVLLKGTNLQLRVWEALLRIPEGHVVSYGDLAEALDVPRGARAVASAVAANRIGYLIPCHRVLRATGEIGGYRWGEDRKRALLAREFSGLSGHLSRRD